MTDLSRVRVTGPLAPFAAGFTAELVAQGYASQAAVQQLRLLAHVSRPRLGIQCRSHRTAQAHAAEPLDRAGSGRLAINVLAPALRSIGPLHGQSRLERRGDPRQVALLEVGLQG
jgi:hypothetical protein